MATKIVTKNSSTASAVPTASDLVQGELAVNVADKRLFTEDNGGSIVELGTNPSTLTVTGEITANGGIALGDNDKATFGAGDDLQIYHNGNNSFIEDAGQGGLYVRASSAFRVQSYSDNKEMIRATADGAVTLYHDNSAKLATTSTGIDVTGSVTATDGSTITVTDNSDVLTLISTDADENSGPRLALTRNSASPADNDYVGLISFNGENSTSESIRMGMIRTQVLDVTDGSEDSTLTFYSRHGGTETQRLATTSTGIDVTGTATMEGLSVASTGATTIEIEDTDNGFAATKLNVENGGRDFKITTPQDTIFVQGSTEAMRIDSSGNVGIGNDAPQAGVHIAQDNTQLILAGAAGTNDKFIAFDVDLDADTDTHFITVDQADALAFGEKLNDNDRVIENEWMRITNAGRVGIGTDLPQALIDLTVPQAKTATSGATFAQLGKTNESSGYASLQCEVKGGSSAADRQWSFQTIEQGVANAGSIVLQPDGGNLLVGKTSSSFTTAGVEIQPSGRIELTRSGELMNLNRLGSDGNLMTFYGASALVGSISVTSSATAYNTSSDYRLKEDWQPMSGATERLKELNPVNFAWKADGSRVDGFLAHEAQEVVPEAVTGEKDAMQTEEYEVTPAVTDEEGNVTTEAVMGEREVPDYQGIDQSKLVPLLVATIQELEARITQLENN